MSARPPSLRPSRADALRARLELAARVERGANAPTLGPSRSVRRETTSRAADTGHSGDDDGMRRSEVQLSLNTVIDELEENARKLVQLVAKQCSMKTFLSSVTIANDLQELNDALRKIRNKLADEPPSP